MDESVSTPARFERGAGSAKRGAMEDVSTLVARQYEAFAYPEPFADLGEAIANGYFQIGDPALYAPVLWPNGRPDRTLRMLVAGCGTVQAACIAYMNPDDAVTGIDLSETSLAHERFLQERHRLENLRLFKGDLLEVASLGTGFDVILCTGVLHHMADPLKGWKALVDVLEPGGLMYIALYSRFGRHHVNACRQEIAERGLAAGTADDIRRYRRELITRHGADRIWLREEHFPFGRDFFSQSNCRDLLFHVNEHQFTIPELKACLATLGLRFQGFVPPALPPNRLWPRYPAPADIDAWWRLEQANPEMFSHAYEFWCRKAS